MSNTLSVYYSPHHWYPQDEEYIRRLDPAWIRIHQPTARAIYTAQKNAPNAKIMLRSWDIDDHNGDRKREMYADPKGAAANHLRLWNAKWHELETELDRNGWAYDESKWFVGLVNEPDPAYVPQVVEYNLEAMAIGKAYGWRLGVVASSVGTFSKPSENGDGWAKFKPLEKPINEGGHILIAHEYWQPEGPNYGEDAGNLAWRHRSIPLNVPILIGESGANGYIYGRYSKNDDSGWQVTVKDEHGNADPHKFAAQVKEYIEGCDQRVQGVCLYMLDYHDKQWASFNTGPANEQLLAIKDARPQRPSPFGAPTQAVTMYVIAPAGANIRSTPKLGTILTAIPYGGEVQVFGKDGTWLHVQAQGITGWMLGDLVSATRPDAPPTPVEPTPTQGDNWSRAWPIVLKIEGGLSLDPNDTGNWYKGQLVGTKYGISAAVWGGQYDIPNLTKAQALEIYKRAYWDAAGCNALQWPMCLIVFDTAVNHGVGVAQQLLGYKPKPEEIYLGQRALRYFGDPKWRTFGIAWGNRIEHLDDIVDGEISA